MPQLLEELENLIVIESTRNNDLWIRAATLSELFFEKYGVSLEAAAKCHGYSDSLRHLFSRSRRFSIYGTQKPQDFYIALIQSVVPGYEQSQARSIHSSNYRIKRPWRIDENLQRTLKTGSAKEILPRQAQRVLRYQPILVSEIKSVDDLEMALMEIIKGLTANYPNRPVTIAILSQAFHHHYRQPIRAMMRSLELGIKLIDLVQSIPKLHVQEVNNDWQITMQISM
ncbi:MAG TPA: hypothetical protein V6C88_00925, partial [Chroococcidiopsis sp.]